MALSSGGSGSSSFEMEQDRGPAVAWSDEEATAARENDQAAASGLQRKRAFGIFLALALSFIAIDYFTERRIEHLCLAFISWVEQHPFLGVLAVICVYTVATILFIPGAILTIGCGFAFRSAFDSTTKGVLFASTAVFIGAFIGSLCSFLLGRYLFRDFVLQLAAGYPIMQAIDRALEHNGLKIMLLLRLSPLIPFNALDYISGVTSISFRDYALALFAILPGTIMFCMVGATASSLTDTDSSSESQLARRVSLVGGLLFAVIGVSVASYYSKQELDKIIRGDDAIVSSVQYQNISRIGEQLQQFDEGNAARDPDGNFA